MTRTLALYNDIFNPLHLADFISIEIFKIPVANTGILRIYIKSDRQFEHVGRFIIIIIIYM